MKVIPVKVIEMLVAGMGDFSALHGQSWTLEPSLFFQQMGKRKKPE